MRVQSGVVGEYPLQVVGVDHADDFVCFEPGPEHRAKCNGVGVVVVERYHDDIDAIRTAGRYAEFQTVAGVDKQPRAGHCHEFIAAELLQDGLSDSHFLSPSLLWSNFADV